MYREKNSNKKNIDRSSFFLKAILCAVGIVALVFVALTYQNYRIKEDKAPYVQIKEILPVLEAFLTVNTSIGNEAEAHYNNIITLQNQFTVEQYKEERYLSYDELQIILQYFPVEATDIMKDYKKGDWYIGLQDWNQILRLLIDSYGNQQITIQEQILLGTDENITDEENVSIAQNMVLTENGIYKYRYWNMDSYLFSDVEAVCYRNEILSVLEDRDEMGVLENVYFVDGTEEAIHFFWNGYHMSYPIELFKSIPNEYRAGEMVRKIADIGMDSGSVHIIKEKEEYVHGKLLQVSGDSMEIEGYGTYPIDESMQVYKVFGELASMDRSDLRLGYSFSDFVIDDGEIVVCLMIKEEDMNYIRVLIKNSDMAGRYHESVSGYCNQEYDLILYEDGIEKNRKTIKKGERFNIQPNDITTDGQRIKVVPSVLSAEITIESISRNQGIPSYFGTLEITRDEDGLLIINEVLLEDYLCKVVPSEMPSSYPKEALMAQAVCARTYAYGKMLNAGLPAFGAHVDDSAGFQVYNNIEEQASTTEAVKATHNTIAVFNDEPIGAYYYSTSCGMGADTGVWHGSGESPAYLTAKEIGEFDEGEEGVSFANTEVDAESLIQEGNFKAWITDVKDSHYESEEGWYRWTYEVNKLDVSHMEEVLRSRYNNNPNLILTKNENGQFEILEIEELGEITNIEITKRITGGIADELVITGTKTTVKVLSELNIRYVLADGVTKVKRQTQDEVNASSTLPSAFIVIETKEDEDKVTGYKITGGGFGHGVGMSQNGAKNMAESGMTCEEILTFFYSDATLKTLQFEE